MSKVYLVSSGSYDDYCVNAVFLDKAKAMQYCADRNRVKYSKPWHDEMRIEERELFDDKVNLKAEDKNGYILSYRHRKPDSVWDVSIGSESDVELADKKERPYAHYFIESDDYNEAVGIAYRMVTKFDKELNGAIEIAKKIVDMIEKEEGIEQNENATGSSKSNRAEGADACRFDNH